MSRAWRHGVVTASAPWAEPNSGFRAIFEALVIDCLKEASMSAVSRLMGLSWNAIDGMMQRAVKRSLARWEEIPAIWVSMKLRSRNATTIEPARVALGGD